jgi:hypothetical protein
MVFQFLHYDPHTRIHVPFRHDILSHDCYRLSFILLHLYKTLNGKNKENPGINYGRSSLIAAGAACIAPVSKTFCSRTAGAMGSPGCSIFQRYRYD